MAYFGQAATKPFAATLVTEGVPDIPVEMLGESNPILHYGEVAFFEDEFADRGFSKANIRFRIMKDCFFVLMRSYTRVDLELVRILDTRIFHQFGTDLIIRDFMHKESTYKQLQDAGFTFNSEWLLAENQSD